MKKIWLIVSILSLIVAATVQAAQIQWKTETYSHFSKEENLTDLLRNFCGSQGLSVVVSEKVTGSVSGRFVRVPPGKFLRDITEAYGLIWYYDGAALFIYRSDEVQSRMINLNYLAIDKFSKMLEELEIADERFPVRAIKGEGIAFVTGPERYVTLTAETAKMLDEKTGENLRNQRAREVVKVFALKYAWADDITYSFMNQEVTVPGVATMLQNILAGKAGFGILTQKQEKQLPVTLRKLKGTGLIAVGKEKHEEEKEAETPSPQGKVEVPQQAFIQADARLNAVIIRDIDEKMPYYEQIISILDVPVGLVQIQATIVDVDTDYLHELGVNWRFRAGDRGDVKTRGGFEADEDLSPISTTLALGQGLNLATIIGDSAEYFLARIHALETDGKAWVLSRPSVLTLDNVEAVLERAETAYVKVPGTYQVDLFDVSVGIVLKVTPHVIQEEEGPKIKLAVKIEDGSFTDVKVDQIPTTKKTAINTQAMIREKESLLIGGYYQEREEETVSRVPCLGTIPGVGLLFREKKATKVKTERMFLITPTIVTDKAYPEVKLPEKLGVDELKEKWQWPYGH